MADEKRGEGQKLSRLGSFMDAVFAIAITLPIVQLTPPTTGPNRDLGTAYRSMTPEFIAYALGFIVIGLFWNYSHFGSKLLKKSDHGFNLLTLLFLAFVSLSPFPARPYVVHIHDSANLRVAALAYGCVLTAPVVVWFVRWCWGVWRGLYDHRLTTEYIRQMTVRYGAATAVSLIGSVLLTFGHSKTGMIAVASAIFSFSLPPADPFRDSDEGTEGAE